MSYQTISVKSEGPITRVTIERADKLNALSPDVLRELRGAIAGIRSDKLCRVVILAGAGDKAFIAGADITVMSNMGPSEALAFAREGQLLSKELESLPQVTIARVQGFALGGGCEMAMACDLIIASKKAKFGQPEVNLGLIPGFGGTQRLARRIGLPLALDLLTTTRSLSGDEALQYGLISRCVDPEKLDEEIGLAIRGLLRAAPGAIAETKRLVRAGLDMTLSAGLDAEASAFAALFGGNEAKDGLEAFLSKRPAAFSL